MVIDFDWLTRSGSNFDSPQQMQNKFILKFNIQNIGPVHGISQKIIFWGKFLKFRKKIFNFFLHFWISHLVCRSKEVLKSSPVESLHSYKNLSKINFKVDPKFLRGTSFDKKFRTPKNFLSKDVPLRNFGSTLKLILDRFLWELRGLKLLFWSANKMGNPKMQ